MFASFAEICKQHGDYECTRLMRNSLSKMTGFHRPVHPKNGYAHPTAPRPPVNRGVHLAFSQGIFCHPLSRMRCGVPSAIRTRYVAKRAVSAGDMAGLGFQDLSS